MTIKNSTLTGNSSTYDGVGGAMQTWGGSVTIVNSTLSGNSAVGEGGGIYADGDGTVNI